MEDELYPVVRHLAEQRWPFRLHATYDQSIARALDVFERVDREVPLSGLHWIIDHAETIGPRSIDRVKALGGGIAVQHRMAFQGEYFAERYGAAAAEAAPPVARMLAAGIPVGAGTDATRVATYNPWIALYWLVSGRTVGGLAMTRPDARLDRTTALRLWTEGSAWFSSEDGRKGRLAPGQYADLAVLSDDYFAIPEERIKSLTSVLTMVGGRIVHGDGEFKPLSPDLPPALPDWSPVRSYGGYAAAPLPLRRSCAVHAGGRTTGQPVLGRGAWSPLGCSCFAF